MFFLLCPGPGGRTRASASADSQGLPRQTLDGADNAKGFALDLLPDAPPGAWAQKTDGSWCLDKIAGPDGNGVTRAWEAQHLDPWNVYLNDDINPVINSNNGRFQVTFFQGVV